MVGIQTAEIPKAAFPLRRARSAGYPKEFPWKLFRYLRGTESPLEAHFTSRLWPVISAGCLRPIMSSMVGARSARTPPSASLPS